MNTTISHHDMAEQLRSELDIANAHAARLRVAIKSVEQLAGPVGTATARQPRPKGPASTVGIPAEMLELGTTERILQVMNATPARRWTLAELTNAIHVASTGSARTTLGRMAEAGRVVQHDDKTWTLVTTTTEH